MGLAQSVFIYSPLDFVEYKNKNPSEPKKLESFLLVELQKHYNIKMDATWRPLLDNMSHKIRCISEGWETLPKIHFNIIQNKDKIYIPKVLKVLDAV